MKKVNKLEENIPMPSPPLPSSLVSPTSSSLLLPSPQLASLPILESTSPSSLTPPSPLLSLSPPSISLPKLNLLSHHHHQS